MAWTPRVTFDLLDQDGGAVALNIANPAGANVSTFGEQLQAVFSGLGSGRISLDPPPGDTCADLLAAFPPNHHILVRLDGTAVFCWRIEQPESPSISEDEEHGQFVTLSGRGWVADFDKAVAFPAAGLTSRPAPDYRIFSFASFDFPNQDGSWVAATVQQDMTVIDPDRFSFDAFGNPAPAPVGWPVPTAEWMWGDATDDEGVCYFRRTFTFATPDLVAITVTADNFYTLYLDGVPILSDTTNPACWREHKRFEVELSAGDHVFAAKVENLPGDGVNPNPGGFLFAMFEMDAAGDPLTVLADTAAGWVTLPYPATEPGWTPGQIIGALLTEAGTRGVLAGLTLDFTDTADSASTAWPIVPLLAVPIGDDVLKVVTQLWREGWIDFRMSPVVQQLSAWVKDSFAPSSGVTLTAGSNIVDLEHSLAIPIANSLLVRYPGGYLVATDATSVAAHGLIESYLTTDSSSPAEANRKGLAALSLTAGAAESVIAEIVEAGSDTPFLNFELGETVTVPNRAGTPTAYRCQTISLEVDGDGEPVFVAEFNRRADGLSPARAAFLARNR